MSRTARSRVAGCVGLVFFVIAVLVGRLISDGGISATTMLAFVIVHAVSGWAASHLQPADIDEIFQFDEAIYIAAALVLPPSGVVLVLAFGTLLGEVADRVPPRAIAWNIGTNA